MDTGIKNLAAAVILQATKEYFGIGIRPLTIGESEEDRQKKILAELNSEWLTYLTDGMSVVVAEQIVLHPVEIEARLRFEVARKTTHKEFYDDLLMEQLETM